MTYSTVMRGALNWKYCSTGQIQISSAVVLGVACLVRLALWRGQLKQRKDSNFHDGTGTMTEWGIRETPMPSLAELSQSDLSDTEFPREPPPSYQSLMAPDHLFASTSTTLDDVAPPETVAKELSDEAPAKELSSSPEEAPEEGSQEISEEISPEDSGMPEYVEVYDEPLHRTVLENDHVRVIKVDCPAENDTMYHRHSQNSFFLFFENVQVRNEVVGKEPFNVDLEAGSFYWGDHLHNPIVHKVCVGKNDLDCMDIEIKDDRPVAATPHEALPDSKSREMCFENDVMCAYRVKLAPGQGIRGSGENQSLGFACLFVALNQAKLSRGLVEAGDRWWLEEGSMLGSDGREANEGEQEAEIMVIVPK